MSNSFFIFVFIYMCFMSIVCGLTVSRSTIINDELLKKFLFIPAVCAYFLALFITVAIMRQITDIIGSHGIILNTYYILTLFVPLLINVAAFKIFKPKLFTQT